MPRKPRDYAAEYARRTAGKAKGTPEYQRARGHVAREHAVRLERERAEAEALGKLTSQQREAIRRFAKERTEFVGEEEYVGPRPGIRGGIDPEETAAPALAWATIHGYDRFVAERDYIRNLGMQGQSMDAIELRSATGEGLPNPKWYYYRRAEFMRGRSYTPRTAAQRARRRMVNRERARRRARRKAA